MERVVVLGLGYVGLPLAVGFATRGLSVLGFDTNLKTIQTLRKGRSTVGDVPDEQLQRAVSCGLTFHDDADAIVGADVYVICVPTPLAVGGAPDLSFIDAAGHLIARAMRPGALVVLESTTYPGTTEERLMPLLELESGLQAGDEFSLAYSPERIDPGNPRYTLMTTPKIVAGIDANSTDRCVALYSNLGVEIVIARGTREAEMAKLLENTYRQINIALVNEMAQFCHAMGIDIFDAISCASSKPFGFQAFWPGPGVGGHCIPIDPSYLSYRVRAELGYPFRFVELAQEINAGMPAFVARQVTDALNEVSLAVKGSRICLLGVAYKRDVADTRESPAYDVARILLSQGAILSYVDPYVDQFIVDAGQSLPRIELVDLERDPVENVVVLQLHEAFMSVELGDLARTIVDTRRWR